MLWPILRTAFAHPMQVAVVDDQRSWRYIDLVAGAFHLAEKLQAISASRNIGVMLPTGGAFPMTLLATWLLGRTIVPINYLLSPEERQYIIDDSEIDTVVTASLMLNHLPGDPPKNVKLVRLDEMEFKGVPPLRWPPIARADDVAVILYTSGTSGRPKGVMLTHANLRFDCEASCIHVGLTSANTFLGVLPQFHSFGLTGLTLLPLSIGAKVVYTARFVPRRIVQLIRKHRPDIMMFIPSMYAALLGVKDATPDDFTSMNLAVSGGEPLPRDVFDRVQEKFGVRLHEGYGLTETSPITSLNAVNGFRRGSVGRAIPGVEIAILDDAGNKLPIGSEGEILIKGPHIMKGYFKMPELTAQVMTDEGYFRTGDWGKVDADGYIFITGRKKEMLIIAGENVFPREIEEVLNDHPSIKGSAVIGRHDPLRGELPVAFVEIEEGATFDEDALRHFCREHIAGFKVPREIYLMNPLPRNPTGKILRRQLVDELKKIVARPEAASNEQA